VATSFVPASAPDASSTGAATSRTEASREVASASISGGAASSDGVPADPEEPLQAARARRGAMNDTPALAIVGSP
jgi:hypothetical protein